MAGKPGRGGQKGRSGGPRPKVRPDDTRGRPPSSYISKNGVLAVKVSTATRSKLELLSARLGAAPHETIERLIDERLAELV